MPVDHSKTIVEAVNLSFSYGETEVLSRVSLEIHPGDYIGLIGPNGAGKSTLLRLLLGLLPLQAGSVRLFGQALDGFRDWQKIGYVPQKATNFDPRFPATVEEVVAMGRRSRRWFARVNAEDEAAVREALLNVDMEEYRERLIGDLSGGQQQRVFIARALVNHPEIVLLDEPTTGVDRQTEDGFYALLQKLNRELGLTLILVSHDVDRIAREAMHIVCVNRTLTCYLTPEAFRAEAHPEELFGSSARFIPPHHT